MRAILLTLLLLLGTLKAFAFLPEHFRGNCSPDGDYCAYFSPDDMPIFAVGEYLRSAKKTIRIATYNMNVDEYTNILRDKLRQGVKVEFMVDYKLSYGSNGVWNSLKAHKNLSKIRIPVMRGGSPQMHNKVIIIDNNVVLMGSANFTYSGLVGNYENVMAIHDHSVIKKFNDELNELKEISLVACNIFASGSCQDGGRSWDRNFHSFLNSGKISKSVLNTDASSKCLDLTKGKGLLGQGNQEAFQGAKDCFKDGRYATLIDQVSGIERYVDGEKVEENPQTFKKYSEQEGRTEVFFSPEDNVQNIILRELEDTLNDPKGSFAYISVNFITNRNIATTLVKMHEAGVRLKVFFDRGRIEDPMFQGAVEILKPLGFTRGEKGISKNVITVFDNQISGDYGCNHNKMAVIGTPKKGVRLLNGSANWSVGAMYKNDENLLIVHDKDVASIYLKEIMSHLHVYRYMQDSSSRGFQDDLNYLSRYIPCFSAIMGRENSCHTLAGTWYPRSQSSAIISVEGVPFDPAFHSVWAWVPQLNDNRGGAVELFTYNTFSGRWVTAVPMPLNWEMSFKLFALPKGVAPTEANMSQATWEYNGLSNDRRVTVAPYSVEVIRDTYVWGRP